MTKIQSLCFEDVHGSYARVRAAADYTATAKERRIYFAAPASAPHYTLDPATRAGEPQL
ncbi:MAG TPA: hypothetical protein VF703_02080 [Pyrinomonadaceae bacterium]